MGCRQGPYLPSLGSSGFRMAPRFAGAEYGVQGDDELSHDGGDNDFARLAVFAKLFGEEPHDGIMLDSDQSRHVERPANGGPPSSIWRGPWNAPLSLLIGARPA